MQVGDRGRVAAAQRGEDRRIRAARPVRGRSTGSLRSARGRRSRTCPVRRERPRSRSARGRSRGWIRRSSRGLPVRWRSGSVLILVNIDICQYSRSSETTDRSRRPAPAGGCRSDEAGDPPPAERPPRGLRLRLHLVLRPQPADGVPSPQGPPGRWLDPGRAPRDVDLVLAAPEAVERFRQLAGTLSPGLVPGSRRVACQSSRYSRPAGLIGGSPRACRGLTFE